MVRDAQVELLRRKRMESKSQEAAAAAAGMSARTARRWENGPLPSEKKKPRSWRTRPDPFATVWEKEIVPLLTRDEDGVLEAKTLIAHLIELGAGQFSQAQVRTLQRRIRDWRALRGPDKHVVFPQHHPLGREAAFDFTHATELGVTIAGVPLVHLLFTLRLSASSWTWCCVAFGETFEALVDGLQDGFAALGGVTEVVRHDNLSAATHELKKTGGRSLTRRFKAVLDHYGLKSTRIAPGESQENGGVEKQHDLVKSAVAQALVLRDSKDFESVPAYEVFVREVIDRSLNRPAEARIAAEKATLKPLPASRVPSYTSHHCTVRRWSTARVGGRLYSVPSRLIGHEVEVRQYANIIEVFYRGQLALTMPRLRGNHEVRIDYRHVIWSLAKKPGAFARYKFREELFPTITFRRAYDALCKWRGDRADIEYVRILHLAASTMESRVDRALVDLLATGEVFDYAAVKRQAAPEAAAVPEIAIGEPDLASYDRLLAGGRV